jgi:hypothetical protein
MALHVPLPLLKIYRLDDTTPLNENKSMGLSKKHRLFVEAFDGDEVYAMRVAGYVGADSYLKQEATSLLRRPEVKLAIEERDKYRKDTDAIVADRKERQALWTAIMRNADPHYREEKDSNGIPIPEGNIPLATRLKASELLGRSEADFIEKVDVTGNLTITDIIQRSYLEEDTEDLEAIEAQYHLLQSKEIPLQSLSPAKDSTLDSDLEDFI